MATKSLFKPKRTRPKIIEIEPPEPLDPSVHEVAEESRPLISVNEYNRSIESNRSADPTGPTAPPVEEYQPTGLSNKRVRTDFLQKVYLVLMGQKFLFSLFTALFVFIPHLRKVFRKWVFDPLFLSSWFVSVPIILFVAVLAISTRIRRKFAKTTLVMITAIIALLLSYVITPSTAKPFLYSMGFSTLTDAGVVLGSRSGIDFTKWRYISLIPIAMFTSGALAPTLLKTSLNNTIWPSIASTLGSTYLAANTVPVIRHNDLDLEPEEYVFAAAQLYINPEQSIRHWIGNWCFGPDNRRRSRTAYSEI